MESTAECVLSESDPKVCDISHIAINAAFDHVILQSKQNVIISDVSCQHEDSSVETNDGIATQNLHLDFDGDEAADKGRDFDVSDSNDDENASHYADESNVDGGDLTESSFRHVYKEEDSNDEDLAKSDASDKDKFFAQSNASEKDANLAQSVESRKDLAELAESEKDLGESDKSDEKEDLAQRVQSDEDLNKSCELDVESDESENYDDLIKSENDDDLDEDDIISKSAEFVEDDSEVDLDDSDEYDNLTESDEYDDLSEPDEDYSLAECDDSNEDEIIPKSKEFIDDDDDDSEDKTEDKQRMIEVNRKWNLFYTVYSTAKQSTKSVWFSARRDLRIPVLNEAEWAEEYIAARIGPWEAFVADRDKFVLRVRKLKKEIEWVFHASHRKKMFNMLQSKAEELEQTDDMSAAAAEEPSHINGMPLAATKELPRNDHDDNLEESDNFGEDDVLTECYEADENENLAQSVQCDKNLSETVQSDKDFRESVQSDQDLTEPDESDEELLELDEFYKYSDRSKSDDEKVVTESEDFNDDENISKSKEIIEHIQNILKDETNQCDQYDDLMKSDEDDNPVEPDDSNENEIILKSTEFIENGDEDSENDMDDKLQMNEEDEIHTKSAEFVEDDDDDSEDDPEESDKYDDLTESDGDDDLSESYSDDLAEFDDSYEKQIIPKSKEFIEDDEDESEDETEDQRQMIKVNRKWDMFYAVESTAKKSTKSVWFSARRDVQIPVLNEIEWAEEYVAARIGPWEAFVADRDRFVSRVRKLNKEIGWVFNAAHRAKIFYVFQSKAEKLAETDDVSAAATEKLPHIDGIPLTETKERRPIEEHDNLKKSDNYKKDEDLDESQESDQEDDHAQSAQSNKDLSESAQSDKDLSESVQADEVLREDVLSDEDLRESDESDDELLESDESNQFDDFSESCEDEDLTKSDPDDDLSEREIIPKSAEFVEDDEDDSNDDTCFDVL